MREYRMIVILSTLITNPCNLITWTWIGSPARINMWTKTRLELIGSEVKLYCRAQGLPKPSITWLTPDNRPVVSGGRFRVTEFGDLIIRDINWQDMGGYQCVAKNQDGEDQSTTFLYPMMVSHPITWVWNVTWLTQLFFLWNSSPKIHRITNERNARMSITCTGFWSLTLSTWFSNTLSSLSLNDAPMAFQMVRRLLLVLLQRRASTFGILLWWSHIHYTFSLWFPFASFYLLSPPFFSSYFAHVYFSLSFHDHKCEVKLQTSANDSSSFFSFNDFIHSSLFSSSSCQLFREEYREKKSLMKKARKNVYWTLVGKKEKQNKVAKNMNDFFFTTCDMKGQGIVGKKLFSQLDIELDEMRRRRMDGTWEPLKKWDFRFVWESRVTVTLFSESRF